MSQMIHSGFSDIHLTYTKEKPSRQIDIFRKIGKAMTVKRVSKIELEHLLIFTILFKKKKKKKKISEN